MIYSTILSPLSLFSLSFSFLLPLLPFLSPFPLLFLLYPLCSLSLLSYLFFPFSFILSILSPLPSSSFLSSLFGRARDMHMHTYNFTSLDHFHLDIQKGRDHSDRHFSIAVAHPVGAGLEPGFSCEAVQSPFLASCLSGPKNHPNFRFI